MSLTSQDKATIRGHVLSLVQKAELQLSRTFPPPLITYRRSGKNAGTAFLQQNRMNLNPVLFSENREAFFSDVIPHELSHLLVFQLYGRVKPHGKEWQYIMQDVFGCNPSATHNFDLAPLKLNTFRYRCACGPVDLSVRRHNKVLRGQSYRCRRCDKRLEATDQ